MNGKEKNLYEVLGLDLETLDQARKVKLLEQKRQASKRYYLKHKDVHKARCRSWALRNPDKVRKLAKEAAKEFRRLHPDKARERDRKKRCKEVYNITEQEYQFLLSKQKHKCAICGTVHSKEKYKKLCVDHSHITKITRGLLCGHCNKLIGFAKENTDILQKAIEYVRRTRAIPEPLSERSSSGLRHGDDRDTLAVLYNLWLGHFGWSSSTLRPSTSRQ